MNKADIENKTIVRLITSAWFDKRGAHMKKSIMYLKRKSTGFNQFEEDCHCCDVDECFDQIINFNDCSDGEYELKVVNISHDIESGHVDNWEYKLVTFKE